MTTRSTSLKLDWEALCVWRVVTADMGKGL